MWPFTRRQPQDARPPRREPAATPAPPRRGMRINLAARGAMDGGQKPATTARDLFRLPEYAPGVLPNGARRLAMDDASLAPVQTLYNAYSGHGLFAEGIGFAGYANLAALSQRSEYRRPVEVIAEEMTRKWIKVTATGEGKAEKVQKIEGALKAFRVQSVFRRAAEIDGLFGQAHIFPDLGDAARNELATPLMLDKVKIKKGSLHGFRVVEPSWLAPYGYDAMDPLSEWFYRPQGWWVMGRTIHASRLLHLVSRPVPDILKPAYNFGGLSLSQMLKPYVDNWLQTRQSVADLIQSFTVFILSTNMSASNDVGRGLLDGGDSMQEIARTNVFNMMRRNLGLMVVDKETEEFDNVSVPLSGLDALQAQSQEHMCAIAALPLVKYFGIQPSGLNASSDGEIRVFYDTIHALQEKVFADPLEAVLKLIQLHEFGEIDPDIGFVFNPLWQMSEVEAATVRKTDSDTHGVYVEMGVITPQEVRETIARDESSMYAGLDLTGEVDAPEDDGEETDALARLLGGGEKVEAA